MTYVPTRRRVMLVAAAVGVCAGIAAIAAVVDLAGLRATGTGGAPAGLLRLRDLLLTVEVTAFVVAAAAWLTWQHRAHRNLIALGDEPRFSPSRAIGAWFVPVLNLLHAPRALHELSLLSRRRIHRAEHARWLSPRFRAWWITFGLSLVVLPVGLALTGPTSAGASRGFMLAHLLSALLRVAAAVPAIHIARDIAARQDRRFAMQRFRVVQAA